MSRRSINEHLRYRAQRAELIARQRSRGYVPFGGFEQSELRAMRDLAYRHLGTAGYLESDPSSPGMIRVMRLTHLGPRGREGECVAEGRTISDLEAQLALWAASQ